MKLAFPIRLPILTFAVIITFAASDLATAAAGALVWARASTVRALALAYDDWEVHLANAKKQSTNEARLGRIDDFVFRLGFDGDAIRVTVEPLGASDGRSAIYYIDGEGTKIIRREYH
jgi:hypothetical protein